MIKNFFYLKERHDIDELGKNLLTKIALIVK